MSESENTPDRNPSSDKTSGFQEGPIQITLDAQVVLEALTGISNEVDALSEVVFPIPPEVKAMCPKYSDPPRPTPEQEALFRANMQHLKKGEFEGKVKIIPEEIPCLTVPSPNRRSVRGCKDVNIGWLPLEKRASLIEIVPAYTVLLEGQAPLNTADFLSFLFGLIQGLSPEHSLLILSDPVVTDSFGCTTIKAGIRRVGTLPPEAENLPDWLINLINQDTHKVLRKRAPLTPLTPPKVKL